MKKPTREQALLARHGILPPESPEPQDCCYPDGRCVSGVPDLVCIAGGGEVFPFGACLVGEHVACLMPDDTLVWPTSELCCERRGGTPVAIPAVSDWGLIVMALLGLIAGTIMFRKARRVPA